MTLEDRLLDEYGSLFRRIWVQTCTMSKRRSEYSVVITLFPIDGSIYRMVFNDRLLNVVDFDACSRIINNSIEVTN